MESSLGSKKSFSSLPSARLSSACRQGDDPSPIPVPDDDSARDTYRPLSRHRRALLALKSTKCCRDPSSELTVPALSTPPSIKSAYLLLRTVFKQNSFRSPQEQIVGSALANEDILVILPTGRGKSLTYQLPAIAHLMGLTIVVSPLLSLIADQVNKLVSLGISAEALNSTTSVEQQMKITNDLTHGYPGPTTRLLYVSPERCAQSSFRKILTGLVERRQLNRFVIDEAHCCVEYGFDFRPDFLKLGDLKQLFPHIPITALTATAPKRMREDIIRVLNLPQSPQLKIYTASVNRDNLHYEVRFVGGEDEPDHILLDIIQFLKGYRRMRLKSSKILSSSSPGAGVIYCRRKIAVHELSQQLQAHGFGAHAYHADKSIEEKKTILHNFVHNEPGYEIVVATTAFGMGVDKPDVRFVIHYDMPNTMEAYYQESGRAGRDGRGARCILYYSREDSVNLAKLRQLRKKKPDYRQESNHSLDNERYGTDASDSFDEPVGGPGYDALVKYCESTTQCRHLRISRYFDPEFTPLKPTRDWCYYACDYCKDSKGLKKRHKALTPIDNGL